MESKNLKTVELPNKEVYAYRECGDPQNKSILFIHPHCYSSRVFEFYFPDLEDKYHLVACDLRGNGLSSYKTPISTMKDLSEDVKLFCDAIQLTKFTIVGWSMGGLVAMTFAAENQEYVEKMILLNTMGMKGNPVYRTDSTLKPTPERIQHIEECKTHPLIQMGVQTILHKNYGAAYDLLTKAIFSGKFKPGKEKRDIYIEEYFKVKGDEERVFATNEFNISKESNGVKEGTGQIENIKCPTIIIAGDKDILVTAEMAKEIKEAMGDKAELKIYEDVGHAFIEEKTAEFIQIVNDFVGK